MSNKAFGFDMAAFEQESAKWDAKEFGASQEHAVKASNQALEDLHEAAGMKAVSIRMPIEMIQAYKYIAAHHGIGYQPMIKQILARFIESEQKMLANELIRETLKERENSRKPKHRPLNHKARGNDE